MPEGKVAKTHTGKRKAEHGVSKQKPKSEKALKVGMRNVHIHFLPKLTFIYSCIISTRVKARRAIPIPIRRPRRRLKRQRSTMGGQIHYVVLVRQFILLTADTTLFFGLRNDARGDVGRHR